TLQDPDGALVQTTAVAMAGWPPLSDLLEEVIGYLTSLPSERRRALVGALTAELEERAAWILHALLHVDDEPTQRLVLQELVRMRDRGALGPIGRLVATARSSQLKLEAESALQRLRLLLANWRRPPKPEAM